MGRHQISFDLKLTNSIYKDNLESLLKISADSLANIERQNEEFIHEMINEDKENGQSNKDWFKESSHLANIDWLFLNSIYTSLFSLFEFHLFSLARVVEKRLDSKVKINDMSGKGIRKYTKYLFLIGEIEQANRSKGRWGYISKYRKVRNIITHNGGIMISDPTKNLKDHNLYPFLKKHDVITAGTLGQIRIDNLEIIKSFIELTSKISDEITQQIKRKYPDQ